MALEIERKFLVTSNAYQREYHQKIHIKQGYLSTNKNRVVRVRITDAEGYLTIKGPSNTTGITRFEWEQKITRLEAESLLALCEEEPIEKNRYIVHFKGYLYEVDEFLGANSPLILAELELSREDEIFAKPKWLGKEVTGQQEYYNAYLSKNPYGNWKK